MAVYHVSSDINCIVLHFGKQIQTINKGDCLGLEFVKGRHKLIFMSAKYGLAVSQSIELFVPENQYEDYFDIQLMESEERFERDVTSNSIYCDGDVVEDENHCKYTPDYRLLINAPKDLKQLTVDKRCEVIRSNAFYGCSELESVNLPSSVVAIGDWAFCQCKKLQRVNMPKNLAYLGKFAFLNCSSLIALYLPDSLYCFPPIHGFSYEREFYDEDGRQSYTQRKPWNVITGCRSLKWISIPSSVREIGEGAFASTHLESIVLPEGIEIIADKSFCYSGLKSITLPNSIVKIGRKAFVECPNLVEVRLSSKLSVLEEGAFCCCYSLVEITLPSSVSLIGDCVFAECEQLKSVIIQSANPPKIGKDVFDSSEDFIIHVPSDRIGLYRAAPGWENYADKIQSI